MIRWLIAFALLLCIGISYSSVSILYSKKPTAQPPLDIVLNEDFTTQIKDSTTFRYLSGAPLSEKLNRVNCVKICYEILQNRMCFINSKRFHLHYDFCSEVLRYPYDLMTFNSRNYASGPTQEYILACINYYQDQNRYVLEFTGNTNLDMEDIQLMYQTIQEKTVIGNSLLINNNSSYINDLVVSGKLTLPVISPTMLYLNQSYQSIENGIAYGRLRMIEDLNKDFSTVNADDIVITKGTPLNIPPCVCLITNSIQSPLSHIQVLCHNRKTPSACKTTIWNDAMVAEFKDQPVRMEVTSDNLLIQKCTEEDVLNWRKNQSGIPAISLSSDLQIKSLVPISKCRLKNKNSVGNKAAAFGEVSLLASQEKALFSVPENACAIPFYFYHQHIQHPQIQTSIQALFNAIQANANQDSLFVCLRNLRKAIENEPIDPTLLSAVETHMKKDARYTSYRFRSSCNAEDIPGFSGAGLYTSKTGILFSPDKSPERAIKKVWASTWSESAFLERQIHHIKHEDVQMAVLVHRSFPDESENGVAITRNIYRPDFIGFTINIQKGDVSVVQPNDSIMCEQFIVMDGSLLNALSDDITTEYITHSSLQPNEPLLTEKQMTQLYNALVGVEKHFYYGSDWKQNQSIRHFAIDVEFKFDKNGKLYLKQARQYN